MGKNKKLIVAMKQVIENDRIIKEIQGEWERKMRREDEEKKSKG